MHSTICALPAHAAASALAAHGADLVRSLPRETAGVVIALCDGTYSPAAAAPSPADAAAGPPGAAEGGCERYPVSLFAGSFVENPRLLRLVLSHCRRGGGGLDGGLRRSLLELTLEEWRAAERSGDARARRLRRDEAMSVSALRLPFFFVDQVIISPAPACQMLSDSSADDMGDEEALVIVRAAGFSEGEVVLYERLGMSEMLLEEYARDGGEGARRKMLALGRKDPELLVEVISRLVGMAAEGRQGQVRDFCRWEHAFVGLYPRLHGRLTHPCLSSRTPTRTSRASTLTPTGDRSFATSASRSSWPGSTATSTP